jgi:hypothetical protein
MHAMIASTGTLLLCGFFLDLTTLSKKDPCRLFANIRNGVEVA